MTTVTVYDGKIVTNCKDCGSRFWAKDQASSNTWRDTHSCRNRKPSNSGSHAGWHNREK